MLTFLHRPVCWAVSRAIRHATKARKGGGMGAQFFEYVDDIKPSDDEHGAVEGVLFRELVSRVCSEQMSEEARDHLAFGLLPAAMLELDERQRAVIRMRFVKEMTLEAIGEFFNLTRERIRQIEKQALETLRDKIDGGTHGQD